MTSFRISGLKLECKRCCERFKKAHFGFAELSKE